MYGGQQVPEIFGEHWHHCPHPAVLEIPNTDHWEIYGGIPDGIFTRRV